MNDDLIFFKTAAGDEAVRERTRLVQRNLRMVLILVDGFADVAALKQKTGDAAMVESALAELLQMDLIESLDAHAARMAQSMGGPPTLTEEVPVAVEAREHSLAAVTVFDKEVAVDSGMTENTTRPREQSMSLPPARKSLPASVAAWWASRRQRRVQAQEEAIYEKAYGEEDSPDIQSAPVRLPGRKARVKLGSLVAMAVAGAVVLAVLRVVLYPYDEYRPQFEQRLSRALDDVVTIGNLHVSFVPLPVIILEHVNVGATTYATAEVVRLAPELGSLTGDHQYREVRVEGLRIKDAGLGRISRWFQPSGMSNSAIRRLDVDDLSLDFGRGSLDGLAGRAELDVQHGLTKFVVRPNAGDFRAEAVPGPNGLSLSVVANEWKAPFSPRLVFSAIELHGQLTPGRFAIDKLEGRAYDGLFSGSGMVVRDHEEARMTINLELQHVASGKLLDALGGPSLIEGEASVRMLVAANAPALNLLGEALRTEGTFKVVRGSLRRIDLAGALRSSGRTSGVVRGGSTGFEGLSGVFSSDARAVRLNGLRLSSGLMQASGQVTVSRQENAAISGLASVEMRSSASVIRSPVAISGRAADPELRAAR
ncbi:MAG TPA: AsmA-like C-terminal region-containing protein [Rhodocyclaceae bacterium]|nr:AsmA-like C-terminal region-containing protein [Rhodocyclaceae bacterium]